MIYEFQGYKPVIHQSSFIHPQAAVTGNVIIGKDVYIGPGAAIRGDWGQIIIEDGCNVQENCTIHMFPGITVVLKQGAHVGHGAIIHGAQLGENVLIGMNAVLMDNAVIGDNSIVGALTFVPTGMIVPEKKVVVGNPAKIVKMYNPRAQAWERCESNADIDRILKDRELVPLPSREEYRERLRASAGPITIDAINGGRGHCI